MAVEHGPGRKAPRNGRTAQGSSAQMKPAFFLLIFFSGDPLNQLEKELYFA